MAKEWFKHTRSLGVSHFHAYIAQREVRLAHVRVQQTRSKGSMGMSATKPFSCPLYLLLKSNLMHAVFHCGVGAAIDAASQAEAWCTRLVELNPRSSSATTAMTVMQKGLTVMQKAMTAMTVMQNRTMQSLVV